MIVVRLGKGMLTTVFTIATPIVGATFFFCFSEECISNLYIRANYLTHSRLGAHSLSVHLWLQGERALADGFSFFRINENSVDAHNLDLKATATFC